MPVPASFYYDLGSPYAWLAAERVERELPGAAWRPVLLGGLFRAHDRGSWAQTPQREAGMAEVERRAAVAGLGPVRWPEPWPGDMLTAMRAAIVARDAGREREFVLRAFRHAFCEGRDLTDTDAVLAAAQTAGLDPGEVRARLGEQSVKDALRAETDAAAALGVFGVPTVVVGGEVLWGEDRLDEAARLAA